MRIEIGSEEIIKAFCGIVLVIASMTVFSLPIPEVTRAYTPTLEDIEFLEWLTELSEKITDYSGLICDELDKGFFGCDLEYLKTLNELLYDYAETALNEID